MGKICKCCVMTIIFGVLLSACSNNINTLENSPAIEEDNVKINGGTTLDEAMEYYMRERELSKRLRGDFFTGKYKIVDTVETSESVNIYAWIVSMWVDKSGNSVSGGSNVYRIEFKKENNLYIYDNFETYKVLSTPYLPQKVSDILSNEQNKIFNDLNEEIDKDIENYLNSL
ncbi:UNVERIFIED_CONTAM: hypothetical protein Cloal_0893 [Acetivibrio alkalicellulosi]